MISAGQPRLEGEGEPKVQCRLQVSSGKRCIYESYKDQMPRHLTDFHKVPRSETSKLRGFVSYNSGQSFTAVFREDGEADPVANAALEEIPINGQDDTVASEEEQEEEEQLICQESEEVEEDQVTEDEEEILMNGEGDKVASEDIECGEEQEVGQVNEEEENVTVLRE